MELTEFITLRGAVSQDHDSKSFAPIGALQTKGTHIDLPYCWFSALDNWDNPTLCAVNSYDLSSDRPSFTGVKYNRPDLVAVAKVIQYAEARDYPAVLAYCDAPSIARQLVTDGPPFVLPDEDLKIEGLTPSKERITFLSLGQSVATFEVTRKADGRWLVV